MCKVVLCWVLHILLDFLCRWTVILYIINGFSLCWQMYKIISSNLVCVSIQKRMDEWMNEWKKIDCSTVNVVNSTIKFYCTALFLMFLVSLFFAFVFHKLTNLRCLTYHVCTCTSLSWQFSRTAPEHNLKKKSVG